MRIRLKLALVDVRTGAWAVLSPKALEDSKISVSPRREVADQRFPDARSATGNDNRHTGKAGIASEVGHQKAPDNG